ncbi:substrate-binding domain-containing protein [Erysipelotrichaceae bacterium RD49]|nr:substrate-binding domain-containing protein [Erysipelotrichaceae bacterium RD49]
MKITKTRRIGCTVAAAMMLSLTGCSNSKPAGDQSTSSAASTVSVLSRESGSGTRSAFLELFGLEQDGQDLVRPDAEVTNSTAVMMTTVGQNPNAIGYISLGSLNDSVKAVSIDGVTPSVETIRDGSYSISRPFLIVEKEDAANDLAQDFTTYILSTDGQNVVEKAGYVPLQTNDTYTPVSIEGSLTVGGSSSVTPVMEKLAEAYQKENPAAEVVVMQSDSSTGASSTVEGVYDLGMLSRELKENEKSSGLKSTIIANDGIVLIVNPANSVGDLTREQVASLYKGEVTNWSDLN